MASLLGTSMLPLAMARTAQPTLLRDLLPTDQGGGNAAAPLSSPSVGPVSFFPQSHKGMNLGDLTGVPTGLPRDPAMDSKLAAYASLPQKSGLSLGDILANAAMGFAAGMGNDAPLQAYTAAVGRREQNEFDRERWSAELEAKRQEHMSPRFEQVGNTIGMFDPGSGNFSPVYTAPGVSGQYALDRGFQPGTQEYTDAVREQRLGSWSAPAVDARQTLEDIRHGNRQSLQNQRLSVTRRGQDLTHQDRQAAIVAGRSNAQLRADTTRGAFGYQHGRGSGSAPSGGIGEGTVIKNPQTGQRMKMQGGKWVPIQ